jgi:undecaprenyl-diphosphatase
MRMAFFRHWALLSAPLLAVLAVLRLGFTTEAAVADFFLTHSQDHPDLAFVLKVVTDWSNPVFYAVFALMLLRAWRSGDRETRRFIVILLAVQAVVAGLAVHFVKHTVGRPRPGQGVWFDPITSRGTYHSLPSGHTTEIVGWSLPLALRLDRTAITALMGCLVGLVGFSRIYLGWHHPTDVFFGWLLGSFGGLATTVLADSTLFRKKA